VIALSSEQGFLFRVAWGTLLRGWALSEEGDAEQGLLQMRQGLAFWQATGAELVRPHCLAMLAETYGKVGQVEEGLSVLTEALAAVDKTGECAHEAELYRLKGELTRHRASIQNPQSAFCHLQSEAEACFQKAIEIARKQQAKSLELRAVMSLVRLRQYQAQNDEPRTTPHETRNRLNEAHTMLLDVYNWFTEGFDTKDLQEAKALLEELA
jgi:predicted ATPase